MQHPPKKETSAPRKQRLSKNAKWLIVLAAAIAIAVAFVLLLPVIKERYPSKLAQDLKADLTFRTLETNDAKTLDSITVRQLSGEQYTLQYREEQLYLAYEDGESVLINESYTKDILEAATVIAVEDTVTEDAREVSEYFADMGLEPPQITVTVSYVDGRQVTLELGKQVPGTTYYYFRWSGDDGVYMCDTGIYEAFEYTAHMLLPVEQPQLIAALIDQMTLETKMGGHMEFGFVADGTEAYLGTIKQPYVYPMDSEATKSLLGAVENFRLGIKIGEVTPENKAEYGFDAPTAVLDVHQQQGLFGDVDETGAMQTYQTEEQRVRLVIGKQDGEFFYYCEYAGQCYRVSSFLLTTLIQLQADATITRAPADMGTASIASVVVQLGDGAVDVRASYIERVKENNEIETDEQGNTIYDIKATVNGSDITSDAFDALVARLKLMTVSGTLDKSQQPTGTPRWQMTVTTVGGVTRTLAAYPLDAFNDLLTVDGVAMHYINAEAIQIALADMYPAKPTTPAAS